MRNEDVSAADAKDIALAALVRRFGAARASYLPRINVRQYGGVWSVSFFPAGGVRGGQVRVRVDRRGNVVEIWSADY